MEKEDKIVKLAVLFYICSIFGYFYELIITYFYEGKLYSHGILNGPWLPIYGTGAVLISILKKYKKYPFRVFVLAFFLTGTLEGICGYILLKFFKMRLWDYTGMFLNIKGFVCFFSAFIFGIGSLVIIYLLMPLIEKLLKKINNKVIKYILVVLTILFSIDILESILNK